MSYELKNSTEHFADLSTRKSDGAVKRKLWDWSSESARGIFELIPKADLKIDLRYQREQTSENRVRKIAANWDWRLFGALSVMIGNDGDFYIYDGGHRWRASKYRDDIDKLPCMLFDAGDLSEQAKAFVGANTMKSNVSAVDHFKAAVVAGEPIACKTQRILDKYGYKVVQGGDNNKYSISAIGTFKALVAENSDLADSTLDLASQVCCNGKLIKGSMLRAFFYVGKQIPEIFKNPIRQKLISLGDETILVAMQRKKAILGEGGYKVESRAVIELINKKRRIKLDFE